jgi:biopolymer transport protein ExbD
MLRYAAVLVVLAACKRDDAKVCPDPATSTAATSAAPMRTIDVPIPKAVALDGSETFLSITIEANGQTWVNNVAVEDEGITDIARTELKASPKVKAIILADRATPHGRVIAVLDRLRMGGVTNLAFGVPAPAPIPR